MDARVLLLCFLACSREVKATPDAMTFIPLRPMKAATGSTASVAMEIHLEPTSVSVNGIVMKDDHELAETAIKNLKEHPDVQAMITAAPNVTFERLTLVMDVLRRAGVNDFVLGTLVPPPEAPR